jgi:hypothetical protein
MILGYALVTCGEEKIKPVTPQPDTDPVDKVFPDSLENFSEIREFDAGDLFDWQNSPSQSQWQYFFVSNSGGTSNYLNTTVLGGYPMSMYFSIPEIMIEEYQENDLLKITWKVKVKSLQLSESVKSLISSESFYPRMAAGLEKENNADQYGSWSILENGNWIEQTQYFPIYGTGTYKPFFICQRPSGVDQLTIWWKDVRCYLVRETTTIP